MSERRNPKGVLLLLVSMLAIIMGLTVSVLIVGGDRPFAPQKQVQAASPETVLLDAGPPKQKPAFSPADIPRWLLIHMGIIASLQVLSVVWAATAAMEERITKRDARKILFLCEIPMYLGLFGTLLGVCLTQFVTGSLVAPLAYCTTMTGVLLHVIGKLGIWLRLPEELIDEE